MGIQIQALTVASSNVLPLGYLVTPVSLDECVSNL